MRSKKKVDRRIIVLSLILVAVIVAYSSRVFQLQITNRDFYLAQANGITRRTAVIKAPRGEILDTYGRPIAVNREGYNITFNRAYLDMDNINNTIVILTGFLKSKSIPWVDELPLKDNIVKFDGEDDEIATLKTKLGLNSYATAQNCFDSMIKRYELEGVDDELKRVIMGVRYTMDLRDFSVSLPYTFAHDVGDEVMTALYETKSEFKGVEVTSVPMREYMEGNIATHIIGTVGSIRAEEWEEYKKKGYSYNDTVGINGIEYAYEDFLRGKDGEITYKLDSSGNIVSSEITKEAVAGNTLILSLDKTLQLVAQNSLEKLIKELNAKNSEITSGSVVVSNVKTGNVLTAANYPSYTMKQYEKDYGKLVTDKDMPLLNRAFQGVYPPGSTFKPAVATIGLQLNKITADETMYCSSVYRYFDDYQPVCMGFHKYVNLSGALSVSCNCYFYELGRRIGITDMNKYCLQYGLGSNTGIELPESTGVLAGSDYSESIGSTWSPGMTLQAAIGQSDNMFTPLQLCMYTSTIANNGVRYKASLLKKIMNYSLTKTVFEYEPTILNKIDFSKSVFSTVKEGMLSVTTEGTGSSIFDDYDIKVGGKSGTAENAGGDHSVFVAFAPYDSPEIAVSVVIEHGLKSYISASLVKEIFDEYFLKQYGKENDPVFDKILQ